MFGSIFEGSSGLDVFRLVAGIWLEALAVRIMDDYLDLYYDLEQGRVTLAASLREGSLPYSLLVMGLAVYLTPRESLSLFGAAYAVGMAGEMTLRYPLGLPGYLEAVLVVAAVILMTGWRQTVFALLVIAAIQAFDDLVDYDGEQRRASRNWAVRWGKIPMTFFALAAGALALLMETVQAAAAFAGVWVAGFVTAAAAVRLKEGGAR